MPMTLRAYFEPYLPLLRSVGWAVEVSADRIALYLTEARAETAVVLLCNAVVPTDVHVRTDAQCQILPAGGPYYVQSRRHDGPRRFSRLTDAALFFLKEACEGTEGFQQEWQQARAA